MNFDEWVSDPKNPIFQYRNTPRADFARQAYDYQAKELADCQAKLREANDTWQLSRQVSRAHIEELSLANVKNVELEKELDRERIRLAACGIAALGYFKDCKEEYDSASLRDTVSLWDKYKELEKRYSMLDTYTDSLIGDNGSAREQLAKSEAKVKVAIEALKDEMSCQYERGRKAYEALKACEEMGK